MSLQSTGIPAPASPVLEIRDLQTHFMLEDGEVPAVDGITLTVGAGRILALVGESGCGKSVTAFSILRLIRHPGRIAGGQILLYPSAGSPIDVLALRDNAEQLYQARGGVAAMIFQEPMTALSPVHKIGDQICEAILLHQPIGRAAARARALEMLQRVAIPKAEKRLDQYPFELSGGMRQRVMIAMALVCRPQLLIADEPTTALDVTIQAQVIQLIKQLRDEFGTAVLLITHDMGVVAQMADDVAVMYLGRIAEQGSVREVLKDPRHPYTRGLLRSLPGLAIHTQRLASIRGSVPSLNERPAGCPFHPRCDFAVPGVCDHGKAPALQCGSDGRWVACHFAEEVKKHD
jgi:oligopeptide/dipeptide ABC transporter ATP-binding protein